MTWPPIVAPYACDGLVLADRHTYEVAANWKVIAENYHECYHCPLIHPELCQVTPPDSGDNYDLPGAWVGGSMDLRDGMATMSLTGELAGTPLPGVDPTRVEYLHLLPNLLVSAHPDYVMAHRMVPLAPDRTWVECSWFVAPGPDGSAPDGSPAPWSSGTSPTSRTGPPASRCSVGSPARTSARALRPQGGRGRGPRRHDRPRLRERAVRAVRPGARWVVSAVVVLACVLAGLVRHHARARRRPAKPQPGPKSGVVKVGSVTLRPCDVMPRALCGSITAPVGADRNPNGAA